MAVQSVGNFTASLSHPLVEGGTTISLKGFKLEDVFINTAQDVENTKRIPLVDGSSLAMTNAQQSGTLTINAVHFSPNAVDGDLVVIAHQLQGLADSIGGVLTFSYGLQGGDERVSFLEVTVKSCPHLVLAGNDVPTYPVVLAYSKPIYP